jgi:signal transduction histidine kinase
LQAEPFMVNELIAQEISHLRPIYPHILFAWQEPSADIAVVADRLKIKQVIANVLNNALEAIGAAAGKIELALSSEGQNAVIRISDNGVGISGEELEMILSENFSSKDLGTGLGLVIARRFLELHRGGLEIVSRPHEGTTIWMRFEKNVKQT